MDLTTVDVCQKKKKIQIFEKCYITLSQSAEAKKKKGIGIFPFFNCFVSNSFITCISARDVNPKAIWGFRAVERGHPIVDSLNRSATKILTDQEGCSLNLLKKRA